jgi:hypothetical protein
MEKSHMDTGEKNRPTVEELMARIEDLEARLSRTQSRPRSVRLNRLSLAIAGAVLAVVASGVAFASMPGASPAIHGCKGKNGSLRIAKTCASREKGVTWNKVGPAGPAGGKGTLTTLIAVRPFHTVPPGKDGYYSQACPAGYAVTGGGFYDLGRNPSTLFSYPSSKNAWTVGVHNAAAINLALGVYAVCAKLG